MQDKSMELWKSINLLVRFLLELSMLAALGYWGFTMHTGVLNKVLFGLGAPLLAAVIWGLWIAPKAAHPLTGVAGLILEMGLFFGGAAALFASGQKSLAGIYAVLVVINKLILLVMK